MSIKPWVVHCKDRKQCKKRRLRINYAWAK